MIERLSRERFYRAAEGEEPPSPGARFIWGGETRPPRAGEWFLSVAIVEAYRAHPDLTSAYPVAVPVSLDISHRDALGHPAATAPARLPAAGAGEPKAGDA